MDRNEIMGTGRGLEKNPQEQGGQENLGTGWGQSILRATL